MEIWLNSVLQILKGMLQICNIAHFICYCILIALYRQHHLRELIIDCLPPQFESNVEMYEEKSLPLGLNSNQKAAIQKVSLSEQSK